MRNNKMKIYNKIFILSLLVPVFFCRYFDSESERKLEQKSLERQNKISEFSKKYNAVAYWDTLLNKPKLFSLDLQNEIVSINSPIIQAGVYLEDITKTEQGYLIQFSTTFNLFDYDIDYYLKANDNLAKRLISQKREYFMEFIIVAQIDKIKKYDYIVSADYEIEDYEDNIEIYSYIELNFYDRFIAFGILLDVSNY